MRHGWKLEAEPGQGIQVSRLSQDREMKNHVSRQSRYKTRVSRLHHCAYRTFAISDLRHSGPQSSV